MPPFNEDTSGLRRNPQMLQPRLTGTALLTIVMTIPGPLRPDDRLIGGCFITAQLLSFRRRMGNKIDIDPFGIADPSRYFRRSEGEVFDFDSNYVRHHRKRARQKKAGRNS